MVQGWVSYEAIDAVAAESGVTGVGLPTYGMTNIGDYTTAGDGILNCDELRDVTDKDGTGIKVGVISNGIVHWEEVIASGDLPSQITYSSLGSYDEGTGMLEIIHDIAPGAELYFVPADTSAHMVGAINYLEAQGVDVIVDDLTFYIGQTATTTEPYFTDGPSSSVASTAREAVGEGIVYVTCPGNWQQPYDGYYHYYLKAHWQGDYSDGGSGWNDFDTSGSVDTGNGFYVYNGATVYVLLQWSDPWPGSSNDYDLYLYNSALTSPYASSTIRQTGSQYPWELITWTNNAGSSQLVNLRVKKYSGSARELECLVYSNLSSSLQFTTGDSLASQQAVEEVITSAAIDAADAPEYDTIEPFSSWGPSTIYTDLGNNQVSEERESLDVSGIDGVHTKIGNVQGGIYFGDPFYGTSASAPHIGGIAALLLDIDDTLSPSEVADLINGNAVDLLASGYDTTSGWGRADAIATISAAVGEPDLDPSKDTGASNSDDLTKLDNSSADKKLQFTVSGTVAGTTVTLFADGTEIGSTAGNGGSVSILTDGTHDLADGGRSIKARQSETGKLPSVASSPLTVTVDTLAPSVSGTPSVNDEATHRLRVASLEFAFNEDVSADSAALEIYRYDGVGWNELTS